MGVATKGGGRNGYKIGNTRSRPRKDHLITHYVLQAGPREGVFVKGLLLEGAGWDMDFATLVEAPPMKVCLLLPFTPAILV